MSLFYATTSITNKDHEQHLNPGQQHRHQDKQHQQGQCLEDHEEHLNPEVDEANISISQLLSPIKDVSYRGEWLCPSLFSMLTSQDLPLFTTFIAMTTSHQISNIKLLISYQDKGCCHFPPDFPSSLWPPKSSEPHSSTLESESDNRRRVTVSLAKH